MKKQTNKLIKHFICHQKPERTFKICEHYLPVCSRCIGIYTGATTYCILAYLYNIEYTPILIVTAFLMITPTLLDCITQYMGLRQSNNKIRLITGIIGGIGAVILIKTIKWILLKKLNLI